MGGDDSEGFWLLGSSSRKREYPAQNVRRWGRCQWPRGRSIWIGLTLAAIGVWALWYGSKSSMVAPKMSFVKVSNGKFEEDCRPLYLTGYNTHDLIQAALMTTYDYSMEGGKSGRERIREMFYQASRSGLNVIRTWAHTNHPKFPFQEKPGKYNENGFKALDYILDQARRHGIHVILSMVDTWKYYNGVDQYVDWSRTAPKRSRPRPKENDGDPSPLHYEDDHQKEYEVGRHALFFNDTDAKEMYRNHVMAIANRKNHMNGIRYKDDPTILAYDILNEPRCETWHVPECPQLVQEWIDEMSAFVKSIDPNHLVTVGSEGFYGPKSEYNDHNPQSWAQDMGQDFVSNHLGRDIDFATIHIWPDNWDKTDLEYQSDWVMYHIDVAQKEIGKPVLLEEFGKKLKGHEIDDSSAIKNVRDPVYKTTYTVVEKAMEDQKNIVGSLYWRWNMPLFEGNGRGEYGVRPGDSTFQYVMKHTEYINRLTNSVPPRKDCSLGCWVPYKSMWSHQCKNQPEVCEAFWTVHTGTRRDAENLVDTTVLVNDQYVSLADLQVFPSKEACCYPGRGAFQNGCSWSL